MSDTALVVVIVVAVVVLATVIALAWASARRRRRTEHLQERFGPEYERVVGTADGRRQRRHAVDELSDREARREELDLRPLPDGARERFATQWRQTQLRFVDQPQIALEEAEALLDDVMGARGYPVDDFDEQAALVSVDHPDLVDNYRRAHETRDRIRSGRGTTEDMRTALLRYRSLFDELLAPEERSSVS